MIHYIKTMAEELDKRLDNHFQSEGIQSRFLALTGEADRLDPRDFKPADRFEFVNLRRRLKNYCDIGDEQWEIICSHHNNVNKAASAREMLNLLSKVELSAEHGIWANHGGQGCTPMSQAFVRETKRLLAKFAAVLDSYLGPEVSAKIREFKFIKDQNLRIIIERDYNELVSKLFPMETWKSVVVIAGSILEALLHDLLTRDQARITAAMNAKAAPKRKDARNKPPIVRDITANDADNAWMLNSYIDVATELALLPSDWKSSVTATLRDFRNCVHPRKELRMSDKITQGEAFQAVGALIRICDYIEKNHP